jgi:hypothetical protein
MSRHLGVVFLVFLSFYSLNQALADCGPAYDRQVKKYRKLSGLYLAMSPVNPGAGVSGAVFLRRAVKMNKVRHILWQANIGGGLTLNKLHREVTREEDQRSKQLTIGELAQLLKTANQKNIFCLGREPLNYSEIRRSIRNGHLLEALSLP